MYLTIYTIDTLPLLILKTVKCKQTKSFYEKRLMKSRRRNSNTFNCLFNKKLVLDCFLFEHWNKVQIVK